LLPPDEAPVAKAENLQPSGLTPQGFFIASHGRRWPKTTRFALRQAPLTVLCTASFHATLMRNVLHHFGVGR